MEAWYKLKCPNCNDYNWIYGGDPEDITCFDIEAFRCWSCEQKSLMPGCADQQFFGEDEDYMNAQEYLDDVRAEWGRKNPDDPYRSSF